jgi:hypothetical protein
MPERGRRKGPGETALQESTGAATVMAANNAMNESVRTAATAGVTENEIAPLAYRLWLDDGCPVGLDREYWFRAEAMLNRGLAAKREGLSRRPSAPGCDNRAESETLVDLPWEGHWEVWEMEWGGARWVWDGPTPGARVERRPARSETGAVARRVPAV